MWFRVMACLLWLSVWSVDSVAENDNDPIVVELFTSQGCYSCPPADTYLSELSEQKNVIALACHVTYWNYLGWKDTFSQSFCDSRQRAYQSSVRGYAGVYTPQMIINGRYGHVGSQKQKVKALINIARQQEPVQPISLEKQADKLIISLPDMVSNKLQTILLLGTSGTHHLPISRGENAGKRLTYHHPVETVMTLGRWDGRAKTLTELVANTHVEQWIVVSQDWPIGAIRAVGRYSIN